MSRFACSPSQAHKHRSETLIRVICVGAARNAAIQSAIHLHRLNVTKWNCETKLSAAMLSLGWNITSLDSCCSRPASRTAQLEIILFCSFVICANYWKYEYFAGIAPNIVQITVYSLRHWLTAKLLAYDSLCTSFHLAASQSLLPLSTLSTSRMQSTESSTNSDATLTRTRRRKDPAFGGTMCVVFMPLCPMILSLQSCSSQFQVFQTALQLQICCDRCHMDLYGAIGLLNRCIMTENR